MVSVATRIDAGAQGSLFATGAPEPDRDFSTLVRRDLPGGAWIDHAPGWLAGSDTLLARLVDGIEWVLPDVELYGKTFVQPRLNARGVPLGDGSEIGEAIASM